MNIYVAISILVVNVLTCIAVLRTVSSNSKIIEQNNNNNDDEVLSRLTTATQYVMDNMVKKSDLSLKTNVNNDKGNSILDYAELDSEHFSEGNITYLTYKIKED